MFIETEKFIKNAKLTALQKYFANATSAEQYDFVMEINSDSRFCGDVLRKEDSGLIVYGTYENETLYDFQRILGNEYNRLIAFFNDSMQLVGANASEPTENIFGEDQLKLSVTLTGSTKDDLVYALREVTRRISEGFDSGNGYRPTASFYFQQFGESEQSESKNLCRAP